MEWQPIETAPKDRTILLAGKWMFGEWEITADRYLATRFPFVGGSNGPTHWMPLPDPPTPHTGD